MHSESCSHASEQNWENAAAFSRFASHATVHASALFQVCPHSNSTTQPSAQAADICVPVSVDSPVVVAGSPVLLEDPASPVVLEDVPGGSPDSLPVVPGGSPVESVAGGAVVLELELAVASVVGPADVIEPDIVVGPDPVPEPSVPPVASPSAGQPAIAIATADPATHRLVQSKEALISRIRL